MEQQNVREMEETNESECVVCCFAAYASACAWTCKPSPTMPSAEEGGFRSPRNTLVKKGGDAAAHTPRRQRPAFVTRRPTARVLR